MNDISRLINEIIADLHSAANLYSQETGEPSQYLTVEHPACILYYGKNSTSFHESIFRGLQSEWGSIVDHIPFYSIVSPNFEHDPSVQSMPMHGYTLMDVRKDEVVDVSKFRQDVMDMLMHITKFKDMKHCIIFCVIDTRGMKPKEFRRWYVLIEDIRNTLSSITCITLLQILLDRTMGNGEDALSITRELADIYEGDDLGVTDSHLYDGVFLYSNQCIGGAFNELFEPHDAQKHGAWDMLSDVMLLANSVYNNLCCKKMLFSADVYPAVTAALKQADKPYRDIAIATLQHLVSRLDQDFVDTKRHLLSVSTIHKALGFKDGCFQIGNSYESQINQTISKFEGFERGLPNWFLNELDVDRFLSELDVDKKTSGCFSAFIAANHMLEFDTQLAKSVDSFNRIDNKIKEQIMSVLTVPQLLGFSKPEWKQHIEELFAKVQTYSPKWHNTHSAIDHKMRQRIAEKAQAYAVEIINDLYVKAEQIEREFDALKIDVSLAMPGVDPNLNNFYGEIVNSFCASGGLQEVQRHAFALDGDRETMVEAIRTKGLKQLFSYMDSKQSIFSLGFMDELTLRMADGKAQAAAQTVIGADLVKNISDLVGYCSMHPLDYQQVEAYLLHVDTNVAGIDWTSSSGKLYSYLNKRAIPNGTSRVFLNIGRKDSASSLWFYALSTDHLRG